MVIGSFCALSKQCGTGQSFFYLEHITGLTALLVVRNSMNLRRVHASVKRRWRQETKCQKHLHCFNVLKFTSNCVAYHAGFKSHIRCATLWYSGVHDFHTWYLENEGKSGAQHVGKTLSCSSVLLLARRRSIRSPDYQRLAHRPA